MRLSVFLLGGLLLSASVLASDVVFRIENAGGLDMDTARIEAVLSSPEVEARITYAPVVALPGWTGRIGLCGISGAGDVCIKKRWRSLHLRGRKIMRDGDSLRFHVPRWHWFGLMPYRPAGPLRVSLPAFWPGALPVNMDANLFDLTPDLRPLADMHLPAPYGGVASWQWQPRRDGRQALPPWRITACDPALEITEAVQPRRRAHRQAESVAEWLRALADSEWWARQIDGVQWQQGEQDGVTWRRVIVQRGGKALQHLQVSEARLLSSQCPGTTRHEFSWQEGRLLAARRHEFADPLSDRPGCEGVVPVMAEALWEGDRLLLASHSGGDGSYYRDDGRGEACTTGEPRVTAGSTAEPGALQRAAGYWQQRIGMPP